jgi:hypothetical protein
VVAQHDSPWRGSGEGAAAGAEAVKTCVALSRAHRTSKHVLVLNADTGNNYMCDRIAEGGASPAGGARLQGRAGEAGGIAVGRAVAERLG